MLRLRTHIVMSTVVTVLMAGILTSMVRPALHRTMQSDFAHWLSNMADAEENSELHKEIHNLSRDSDDWSLLLSHAGSLVKHHKELFKLPGNRQQSQTGKAGTESSPDEHENAFQWLMLEWNLFNKKDSMSKTTAPVRTKLTRLPMFDHLSAWFTSATQFQRLFGKASDIVTGSKVHAFVSTHAIPLIGGTAIGAP